MSETIAAIKTLRANRDKVLRSLEACMNRLNAEMAQITTTTPYFLSLIKRHNDLMNQYSAALRDATDEILAINGVVAAASELGQIAQEMETVAGRLPQATKGLSIATEVLTLGQKFTDLLANLQNHA